jgi:hypothetical protein
MLSVDGEPQGSIQIGPMSFARRYFGKRRYTPPLCYFALFLGQAALFVRNPTLFFR